MLSGIIIKGIGGFYYIKTADGTIYECKARGVFRKRSITPMVGDRVKIETGGGGGSIAEIEPRTSELIRPPVANIDTLVIVAAAASPEPSLFLIDKMLINAEKNNINAVICINKTDLAERSDIYEIYTGAGYKVIGVCASKKENLDELKELIKGKITAFAGLSGVGKSTILSAITKGEMRTGEISEKIGRGKHTTRHVELLELEGGGYALDTPGFGQLELDGIYEDELYKYFPEMREHEGECRFRGCAHIKEPDCVIRAMAESGGISRSRYESYTQLYAELKAIPRFGTNRKGNK